MSTDYHAKYFAHSLNHRYSPDPSERLADVYIGTQIDLNPHQVSAALFAFNSPFSRGAILADEVGLGKTIEAGLLLAQRWAEGGRRILIITPASLRKQWEQELREKFGIPCIILESESHSKAQATGRPFEPERAVVICSYQFAFNKQAEVAKVPWDLVVIDEAHRLRNVYQDGNVIASALKRALTGRPKILLTATPLQNSLAELYGLVSIIDDGFFGSLSAFLARYVGNNREKALADLKERMAAICHRTLRRQVARYISFTKRRPILETFQPSPAEASFYDEVSYQLSRGDILPKGPRIRYLMRMVLWKLLGSSTFAIGSTFRKMSARLKSAAAETEDEMVAEVLGEDYEGLALEAEESDEDATSSAVPDAQVVRLDQRIAALDKLASMADAITENAKGAALLQVLKTGLARVKTHGAPQKALVFTESRATQDYIVRLLESSRWKGRVVTFNGSNDDPRSQLIYDRWLDRHSGDDTATGHGSTDRRAALVEHFREEADIMVATEAGAEGLNLQFCAFVVNYDLPWNPQRVEQRIGRCHRYGQQHDVVVANFINKANLAERRVLQLFKEKLGIFEGVFGASDRILGRIGNGTNLEREIGRIFDSCRTPQDINEAFERLQEEFSAQIEHSKHRALLELHRNFDDAVLERIKDAFRAMQNRFERQVMALARHELKGCARFLSPESLRLDRSPYGDQVPLGRYELPRTNGGGHLLQPGRPLVDAMIASATQRRLPPVHLRFTYLEDEPLVAVLAALVGKSGLMALTRLTITVAGRREEHLLLTAITDDGVRVRQEHAERMFHLPATVSSGTPVPEEDPGLTAAIRERERQLIKENQDRNAAAFAQEERKLREWATDLKVGLRRKSGSANRQLSKARQEARDARSFGACLAALARIDELKDKRAQRAKTTSMGERRLDKRRDDLVEAARRLIENRDSSSEKLMWIGWSLA